MPPNLLQLETPQRFEELCHAILSVEYDRYQPFSSPDLGMDGYEAELEIIFQFYFPEGAPRRDKIQRDLLKAREKAWQCKRWVLILPKDPTPVLTSWLDIQSKTSSCAIEVWGKTKLLQFLRKHPSVREMFFPTELRKEIRRLAHGKRPHTGDAEPGEEIDPADAAELKQLIDELVAEAASRKKRTPKAVDYSREYGEFKAYFKLSAYDRLSTSMFPAAKEYCKRKRYGRRQAENQLTKRRRCISGIKAIQKNLRLTDHDYRAILFEQAGVSSTTKMDLSALQRVFVHFQYLQGSRWENSEY